MSRVTDLICCHGICDDERDLELLAVINSHCPTTSGRLVAVPGGLYRGSKCPQAQVAVGAFNDLDLDGWVEALRGVDFAPWGCGHVQFIAQEEDCTGFGIIDIWRSPAADPAYRYPNGRELPDLD
jgi:hypothetical protein